MKKLLIFCSSWMYQKPVVDGWDVYCNIQEDDPRFSSVSKFDARYVKAIHDVRPDFVVAVNVGCSEQAFDRMVKPKKYGTKYISWSTDSYRHAKRVLTSDIHLSSIPDATLSEEDNFVPLFFDAQYPSVPFVDRLHHLGIHCRRYDNEDNFRQRHLDDVRHAVGDKLYLKQENIPPLEYISEAATFKYGLNIGTYHDGLPNFRSFEFGSLGVMPVCSDINRKVLEDLFDEHIRFYNKVDEIPGIIRTSYDERKMVKFYRERHSFAARLSHIFKFYFDLRFESIV
ncbi:MAG: hypothetical protein GF334_11115 [Candidatus Altiarchaeales archaeon]|nr:hypothetical protein [Candidatus Altiarchaeales archaeon]